MQTSNRILDLGLRHCAVFVIIMCHSLAAAAQLPATGLAASDSLSDDPFLTSPAPHNTLTGRIVGTDGQGVPGVMVGAVYGGAPSSRGSKVVTADKDGRFTIGHLPDGKVSLRAVCRGFRPATFTVQSDSNGFMGILRKTTEPMVLRARATDANGKPMPGVPLLLIGRGDNTEIDWSPPAVPTDAAGYAELVQAPANLRVRREQSCIVMCDREGYDLAFGRTPSRDEDGEIVLVLQPTTIPWRGRVVSSSGQPVPHANITVSSLEYPQGDVTDFVPLLLYKESSLGRYLTAETDAEGVFELPRIPKDGRLSLTIVAQGFESLRSDLKPPTSGRTPEYRFVMRRGVTINGRVQLAGDGLPIAGDGKAEVEFMVPGGEWVAACVIKADGTFATDRVPAGTYLVGFSAFDLPNRRYVTPNPVQVTLVDGEPADITIKVEEGLPVCGKVVGFANIAAKHWLPSVTLWAMPGKQLAACREVSPDGTFEIYLAREGQYLLGYPTAKGDAHRTLDVRKGQPIKDLVVDVSINGDLDTTDP